MTLFRVGWGVAAALGAALSLSPPAQAAPPLARMAPDLAEQASAFSRSSALKRVIVQFNSPNARSLNLLLAEWTSHGPAALNISMSGQRRILRQSSIANAAALGNVN